MEQQRIIAGMPENEGRRLAAVGRAPSTRVALGLAGALLALVLTGCGQGGGGGSAGMGGMANVRVSAATGSTVGTMSARAGSRRQGFPAATENLMSLSVPQPSEIVLTVSAQDFPEITQVVPASQTSVTLQIPPGAARLFTLTYKAADGTVLGSGQTTVDIFGGSVDVVISVQAGVPGISVVSVVADVAGLGSPTDALEVPATMNVTLTVQNSSGTLVQLLDSGLRFRTFGTLSDSTSAVGYNVASINGLGNLPTGQSRTILINGQVPSTAPPGVYRIDGMVSGSLGGQPFALRTCIQTMLFHSFAQRGVSLFAGNGAAATAGDGQNRTSGAVSFNQPLGLAIDPRSGDIYVAELSGNVIRQINASGILSTVAGTGLAGSTDNVSPATLGQVNQPRGMVVDGSGNVFLADEANHVVRRFSVGGFITTVVGQMGVAGSTGDGGPPTSATLAGPEALVFDPVTLELLIADSAANNVRAVDFGANRIRTVAGNGTTGLGGDGGLATAASVEAPTALGYDTHQNLLIGHVHVAGANNFGIVRRVNRATGTIQRIAGIPVAAAPLSGFPALDCVMGPPTALLTDPSGELFIVTGFGVFVIDAEGVLPSLDGASPNLDGLLALLEGTASGATTLPQAQATNYQNGALVQALRLSDGSIIATDFVNNNIIQLR